MSVGEPSDVLLEYLQQARQAMIWKLDGLAEYDVRRPLTPTGTSLLGLVQHLAFVEAGYFGVCLGHTPDFEAEFGITLDEDDPDSDLVVEPLVTHAQVVAAYRTTWERTDANVRRFGLEHRADVAWWGEDDRHPTVHTLLVHVTAETHRHAGHADILRELLDGGAGRRLGDASLDVDKDWPAHMARVERAAQQAAGSGS